VLISFSDHELAALRTAATPLSPEQRDRFLRDVANELGHCREIGPGVVARVATAVQRRLVNGNSQGRRNVSKTMIDALAQRPA
jgi:hypothetical protein